MIQLGEAHNGSDMQHLNQGLNTGTMKNKTSTFNINRSNDSIKCISKDNTSKEHTRNKHIVMVQPRHDEESNNEGNTQ